MSSIDTAQNPQSVAAANPSDEIASSESQQASPTIACCENCQAILQGQFCHACGQAKHSPLLAFGDFFLTLLGNFFSYDSKVNRTLIPLLLHPGSVCNEYLHGHRVKFIAPLRLYLFSSVIFFLLLPWMSDLNFEGAESVEINKEFKNSINTQITRELEQEWRANLPKDEADRLVAAHLGGLNASQSLEKENIAEENVAEEGTAEEGTAEEGTTESKADDSSFNISFLTEEQNQYLQKRVDKFKTLSSEQITDKIKSNLPTVMFFVLPLFALVLKITNIFKGRYYAEHFVVALYAQSYVFIMLTLIYLLEAGGQHLQQGAEASAFGKGLVQVSEWGFYWMLFHLFLMQKSIYKQSWFGASCQYLLNLTLYATCLLVTFLLALLWNFMTLEV